MHNRITVGVVLLAGFATGGLVLPGCHSPAPGASASPPVIPVSRPIQAPVYDGRILTFDPVRRYLTLAEVRQTYPPVSWALPPGGVAVGERGVDGRPLDAKDNTLTFQVAGGATITLGGRRAALGDLRADMWAKVWTRAGTPAAGAVPDAVLTAERIEARTQAVLADEENPR